MTAIRWQIVAALALMVAWLLGVLIITSDPTQPLTLKTTAGVTLMCGSFGASVGWAVAWAVKP